jgi:signal peptidase II
MRLERPVTAPADPRDPAAEAGPAGGGPPAAAAVAADGASPAPGRARLFWWLSLVIIAADQAAKAAVRGAVAPFETRPIIAGAVDLVHVRNEGVAFGLFNSTDLQYKWLYTTALALAALAGVTYFARHLRPEERLARVGLSMILGGALGNLIDRVRYGYVLDFVDAYWRGWHFWAFNVADACITFGAVFVFAELLLVKPHASHSV